MDDSSRATPLDEFCEEFFNLPLIEQTWPSGKKQTYLEWLALRDPNAAAKSRADMEFVREFAVLPIVAVAGLINSGKSSLVAAFLSSGGRERVLRGEDKRHGTQRFTLWLPAAWRTNAAFLDRLETTVARVFGHAAEPLKLEPAEALAQQREVGSLHVPLLAFDRDLDRLGIALFDCPDIQRAQPDEPAGANVRLEVLRAAGEICAGVILVAPRKEVEVRELENLASQLPAATRIYAINFLRRETPDAFLRDAAHGLGIGERPCYVAYDHEVETNRTVAPSIDPNFQPGAEADPNRRVPFFFEASPEPEKNAPAAVGRERSLLEIGRRLSTEALRQRRQSELTAGLKKTVDSALAELGATLAGSGRALEEAHIDLFETLLRLMHDGKRLRIKIDPEISAALAESIRRTAPWDIRLALLLKKKLLDVITAGAAGVGRALRFFQALGGKNPFAARKEKLVLSQFDPARLQEELTHWSARHGAVKEKSFWTEDAGAIVERFRAEERTNLPPAEWDALTKEFWKSAPRGRARIAMAASVITTLGAAVWIVAEPFSGAVVFSALVKGHVVALTIGELFGGLVVITGGVAGASGFVRLLEKTVETRLGYQQFSNLFAIACDRVGLPREVPARWAAEFPSPRIAEQRKRDAFGTHERRWLRAEINQMNLERLRSLLAKA